MSAYPNRPTHEEEGGYGAQGEGESGTGARPVGRRPGLPRQPDSHAHDPHAHGGCVPVPEFKRLNYFYGQMLGAADFRAEQDYFREKLKLHNRCLHGYGVVCGLGVVPEPVEQPCAPEGDARLRRLREELERLKEQRARAQQSGDADALKAAGARAEEIERELERIRAEECEDEAVTRVVVECGLAIDCEGNEIVVRRPIAVDLWRELSRADRDRIKDEWNGRGVETGETAKAPGEAELEFGEKEQPGGNGDDGDGRGNGGNGNGGGGTDRRPRRSVYLSICFCEQPTDPVRPVMADACGATAACNYGRVRDSFKIRVTTEAPEADERCATCCEACADPCLLLARIDNFRPGRALDPEDIHNEVRRPISLHVPTVITGISWSHGAEYTEDETQELLGLTSNDDPKQPRGHLVVRFSRPVDVLSVQRGVIDVWVTQGGGGRHADVFNLDLEYVDLPESGMTDEIRFRAVSDESPNPGDRILFIIRGSHILDACCRPVDAANTGGRTPFLPDKEFEEFRRGTPARVCQYPPPFGYGPWTSGTNAAGADHVSWIYVRQNQRPGQKAS